jgi:5-methylcytosine-specific restriction endonuclease McrA
MRTRNEYPENWIDTIRPSVLKRDLYHCVKCNIKHRSYVLIDQSKNRIVIDKQEHDEYKKEGWNTYRIFLQVSHINHDKSNCDLSNLQSLCNQCHLIFDREHSRIMRLAPPPVTPEYCEHGFVCPYGKLPHTHSASGALVYFL